MRKKRYNLANNFNHKLIISQNHFHVLIHHFREHKIIKIKIILYTSNINFSIIIKTMMMKLRSRCYINLLEKLRSNIIRVTMI